MILKKSGKIATAIIIGGLVGWYAGYFNKKTMIKTISLPNLSVDNYVNRLKEFDMSSEKEATNLFYDLIESGFSPHSAFDLVKKECLEAGEIF